MQLVVAGAIVGGDDACSFYLATLKHLSDVFLDRLGTTFFLWLNLHVLFELELLLCKTVFIFP